MASRRCTSAAVYSVSADRPAMSGGRQPLTARCTASDGVVSTSSSVPTIART